MKRNDLLKYLRSQGCELVREGGVIHGGGIQVRINDHLCQGIQKSTITLREKYAKTSG